MTSPLVERVARAKILAPSDWFKLPLAIRQRYWSETDYGRLPASAELWSAIDAALKEG